MHSTSKHRFRLISSSSPNSTRMPPAPNCAQRSSSPLDHLWCNVLVRLLTAFFLHNHDSLGKCPFHLPYPRPLIFSALLQSINASPPVRVSVLRRSEDKWLDHAKTRAKSNAALGLCVDHDLRGPDNLLESCAVLVILRLVWKQDCGDVDHCDKAFIVPVASWRGDTPGDGRWWPLCKVFLSRHLSQRERRAVWRPCSMMVSWSMPASGRYYFAAVRKVNGGGCGG
jgi:hypothetical protein